LRFLFFKSAAEKAQIAQGRAAYAALEQSLGNSTGEHIRTLAAQMRADPNVQALSVRERDRLGEEAIRRYANIALADSNLTEDEEETLHQLLLNLGFGGEGVGDRFHDLAMQVRIARANAGRLGRCQAPKLMAKAGEVVYSEWPADLVKEVAKKEYRGGYSGFSFRIVKGVSYHVGGTRGRMVTTGTELHIADRGTLSITSMRAVFLGTNATLEFLGSKLVGLDVYDNGIRFHVANRQAASTLRVENGHVVAAELNAAFQHLTPST
jgi:hypothetical protein